MAEESAARSSGLAGLADELRAWHAAHPQASLSALEQALDQRLYAARAELLAELATDTTTFAAGPSCGVQLVRRGQHSRTLTTQGGEALTLERTYLTCPACGDGLFPPR